MKKTSLCIIFGGKSTEYEISLRSAYTVLTNIDKDKYDITAVGITKRGYWYCYTGPYEKILDDSWCADTEHLTSAQLSTNFGEGSLILLNENTYRRIKIDVVFPVVHGVYAEDGTLQGLLELSGIPYVGSDCASSALCMDKAFTKQILNNHNIPQAKCIIFQKSRLKKDPDAAKAEIESQFSYPVFVKPSNSGSSVGASKVAAADALIPALFDAARYDDKVIVEEYINAKEIEVAVLGNDTLTVSECGEIAANSDFYDYDTKYVKNISSYYIPARIDEITSEKIRSYAKKIYRILGCKGLSRVDFFVKHDNGDIIFNEINTLPGFTSISMYPKLLMHAGLTLPEIIDRLIQLAKNH